MGKVHWKRYFISLAPRPPFSSGHTVMILTWPVAWSYRTRLPPPPAELPTAPETTMLASWGWTAMWPLSELPTV